MENMFSLKRSQTINISLLAKFLENQAENTVFPFQISNIEWNLYSVKSIDLICRFLVGFAVS